MHDSTTGCNMLKSKVLDGKLRESLDKQGKMSVNKDRDATKILLHESK